MATRRFISVSFLALVAAAFSAPSAAQDSDGAPAEAASDPAAPSTPPVAEGALVYVPGDFAQYAPRNALDMVANLPGFQIKEEQNQQGAKRGLGQASGNVLVNGERLASKSASLRDQLARIPGASVVRIEVVDGATLAIPGLSGQVANIVTSSVDSFSGQFRWDYNARAHYTEMSWLGGEVSVKGVTGPIEYTAAISNNPNRGAFGGPFVVEDGTGAIIENRDGILAVKGEDPKIAVGLKFDGPGSSVGNLSATYDRPTTDLTDHEFRDLVTGTDYDHTVTIDEKGYNYEIAGDYEFAIGPGRLKLIGLERYNHSDFTQTAIDDFVNSDPDQGGRYAQITGAGERIARGEYSWKLGKADMQLAVEAAFNRLDKEASLFSLEDGDFVEIDFPEGDGGVTEDRYETILTVGYPLAANMTLQTGVGWEYSKLAQTGTANTTRKFWRPKGSATLAWTPEPGLDITAKIERRVGQLQFGDFLARVFLENGNENGVNAELVPEQAWDSDLTIKKSLGKWGSTQIRFFDRSTQDFIDVIPLEGGGEARGNIDKNHRFGFEWTSTLNLDPIGIKGAKIDLNAVLQHLELTDPVTGEKRPESFRSGHLIDLDYRHDIPGTAIAYGASLFHIEPSHYYRVYEEGMENEGPAFVDVFVEHKDVFGLTVTATVGNILGATHDFRRTVYEDVRGSSPIAFVERGERRIGPIFNLTVKGDF